MHSCTFSANARRLAWLVLEKALFLASTFLVGNWMARALGPEDFGRFSAALSISAVFGTVATMGLDTVLLRRFTIDATGSRRILASAVTIRAAGAVAHVAFSVGAGLLLFGSDREGVLTTLLIAGAWLLRCLDVTGLKLQVEDRYPEAVGIRVATRAVGDAVRIVLILQGPSLLGFALAAVAEAAMSGALFHFAQRPAAIRNPSWNPGMFRECLPIVVSGLLAGLYARVDQAVVYGLLGPAANGQYAAAVRLSELLNVLVVSLGAVAAPHFARLTDSPPSEFDRHLRRYVRAMTLAGMGAGLVLSLGAEAIIGLLYGSAFGPAASVLRIHAWSVPLVFMSVALEPWFFHYGKLDLYVLKTLVTLAVALPVMVLAAWFGGVQGVAAGLVGIYAVSVFGTNAVLPQARGVFRFQLSVMLGPRRGGAA